MNSRLRSVASTAIPPQARRFSERLGAIRAQLRQQGAQGLQNLGQQALGSYSENIHQPASGGFLEAAAPLLGSALGSFAGPLGTAAGGAFGGMLGSAFGGGSSKGQASPWGWSPGQDKFQTSNPWGNKP